MTEQKQLSKCYSRPKIAYQKLKTAKQTQKNVYISGMIGYGKTSLIRHFLENDDYLYFSCKNGSLEPCAEELASESSIVVIDDISFLTEESSRNFVREQLKREDAFIVTLGRSQLPKWLKPCYYESPFLLIDEDDLHLKDEEMLSLFNKQGIKLSPNTIETLNKRIHGYPIVANMIALHLKNGTPYGPDLHNLAIHDFQTFLEYELFQKWDSSIYHFLLQVSIVDRFTYKLAEMITGRNDVESMIEQIFDMGSFLTIEKDEFFMPPFLLKCLRLQLSKIYTKHQRNDFYYNAGLYYEMEMQVDKALNMYEICENHNRILAILTKNVEGNLNSCHLFDLRHYYMALPEDEIKKSVSLMAGMSMLYSLLMQPEESEHWYRCLKNFEKKQTNGNHLKKEATCRLAYLDVALPHRGSHKIKEMLVSLATMIWNKNLKLPEFSVTSNLPSVMNGGKDFCDWSLYDRTLAAVIDKPLELALGKYGKGFANIALGESLFEKGTDDYEVITLLNKGRYQAENGGKLEMCFAAIGVLVRLELQKGQIKNAKKLLCDFKKKILQENALHMLPNLNALECRLALRQGDHTSIQQWMEEAPEENIEFSIMARYLYLTKIRVYLLEENWEAALDLLQRMLFYAEKYERTYIYMEAKLLLAIYQYRTQNRQWKATFKELLMKTEHYGFIPLIAEEGDAVLPLLQKCDHKEINNIYYKQVVEATVRMAKLYPAYLSWSDSDPVGLSTQAVEILRMQSEGMTAKAIAEKLHIAEATVRYHSKNTYSKLGAAGKMDAVRIAKEMNMI